MTARFDWSQVAAREALGEGLDGLPPGPFAELGRRAGMSRPEDGSDFWSPVDSDPSWRWGSERAWSEHDLAGDLATLRLRVDPSRRARIAPNPEGGGTTGEREAEEDAFRMNAVLNSGNAELIRGWLDARSSGDDATIDRWWADHYRELGLAALSCAPLERPGALGSGDCVDTLPDPDPGCSALACDVTRENPDMTSLAATSPPVRIVNLQTASSDCRYLLPEIIRAAWALLLDNIDLVRWAGCQVYGAQSCERGACKCLPSLVTGRIYRIITIWIVSLSPVIAGSIAGLGVFVYAGDDYWKIVSSQWCCGSNSTRLCIALDVAAVLFHELTHSCVAPVSDLGNDNCPKSYVAESVFRWALFRRYPDLDDTCCGTFVGDDELFAFGAGMRDVSKTCELGTCQSNRGISGSGPAKNIPDLSGVSTSPRSPLER